MKINLSRLIDLTIIISLLILNLTPTKAYAFINLDVLRETFNGASLEIFALETLERNMFDSVMRVREKLNNSSENLCIYKW